MLSIIVAMDEKRGIGKNNKLMWHIPGELPRFKRITTGHPIIMGRKTFESIGRVLPGRTNIIITRDASFRVDGAVVAYSLDQALGIGEKKEESRIKNQELRKENHEDNHNSKFIIQNSDEGEVFIIGGGQIFEQALPLADKLYLTIVKGDFGADTFFPDYPEFKKIISKETHDDGGYQYTFLEIEK